MFRILIIGLVLAGASPCFAVEKKQPTEQDFLTAVQVAQVNVQIEQEKVDLHKYRLKDYQRKYLESVKALSDFYGRQAIENAEKAKETEQ